MVTIHPAIAPWHESEIDHINVVELKPIEIDIRTYYFNKHYSRIRATCSNMTVLSFINNMADKILTHAKK